jgi:hypothetical protein
MKDLFQLAGCCKDTLNNSEWPFSLMGFVLFKRYETISMRKHCVQAF